MARRNVVLGLAATGILAMWIWLLVVEILDTVGADAGERVTRSDLRTGVMTLLTGLLGAALAVLVSAGGDQLRDVPRALGFRGDTLPQLFTFLYAVTYVIGVMVGLGVAVLNEGAASSLLIATSTGGLGALAAGVGAWLGLNLSPPAGARPAASDADSGDDGSGGSDGSDAAGLIEELTGDDPEIDIDPEIDADAEIDLDAETAAAPSVEIEDDAPGYRPIVS